MSKALGMDTAMAKSPAVDIAMSRHGYSDTSFLLHRILHQKVRNVENLRGKIRAFVLVIAHINLIAHIILITGINLVAVKRWSQ